MLGTVLRPAGGRASGEAISASSAGSGRTCIPQTRGARDWNADEQLTFEVHNDSKGDQATEQEIRGQEISIYLTGDQETEILHSESPDILIAVYHNDKNL